MKEEEIIQDSFDDILRKDPIEFRDLAQIYERLPFFNQKILYPEFDPALTQYKKEAQILIGYLKEKNIEGCQQDHRGVLSFPVKHRWLRGEEYGFMLRHYKTYNSLGMIKVNQRTQDPEVYDNPKSNFKSE